VRHSQPRKKFNRAAVPPKENPGGIPPGFSHCRPACDAGFGRDYAATRTQVVEIQVRTADADTKQ